MADWIATTIAILLIAYFGAVMGHLLYGRRYKQALQRIVTASKHPSAHGFGPALEAGDKLLGRQR